MGPHRGNRHGRSEQARLAVLEAADDLLVEKGFAGLTIEAIATSAGVAKQTIYRWWSTKTDILLDAFLQDAAEDLPVPDHGDIGRDLREYLRQLAHFLTRTDAGAVLRALLGHAQHDPEFAAVLRERYLDEQHDRDRLAIERTVTRGLLPADLDVAAEVEQLVGPIYYRALVTGSAIDEDFTNRLVDAFLSRIGLT
ncbi:TetR/AcrR family transcriptional regulator [Allokutzneria sp. A3M-2-11 16]|uniref:TetR/AcrR family transcriptional regulator n=1 Tax=Allokutzneria sp. A3M-2-11 16 TaxID=2962043 RepID=UPI0020B720A2|nr:TetR/AcrR family transcriptional regulator [Allokutzneria sp. A3M-2-11 16]MCP3804617.1 TetR/AcrR family transcriptional regulator [Allokutzneria sp. A3M-2-11 16]